LRENSAAVWHGGGMLKTSGGDGIAPWHQHNRAAQQSVAGGCDQAAWEARGENSGRGSISTVVVARWYQFAQMAANVDVVKKRRSE